MMYFCRRVFYPGILGAINGHDHPGANGPAIHGLDATMCQAGGGLTPCAVYGLRETEDSGQWWTKWIEEEAKWISMTKSNSARDVTTGPVATNFPPDGAWRGLAPTT
ncbi:unnamed protein product [Penicillium pancosmium]